MAERWQNNDSARTMTKKYNEMVDQINGYEQTNKNTEQAADDVRKLLGQKVDKDTAKKDLGIDKIDNTPDMDKPLSNPQARAMENAIEDMLTSEPINGVDVGGPPVGVLVNLSISGTKLILDTENAEIRHKITVFVRNTKLMFVIV